MVASVAELCEQKKISAADLARQIGLDEGRVTAIMMGRWTPSPAERQKIAAAFNLTIDEIAWGHKTPVQHLYGHGPGGQTS
jgi:transcriptional regulator with XRE-family HTH domain